MCANSFETGPDPLFAPSDAISGADCGSYFGSNGAVQPLSLTVRRDCSRCRFPLMAECVLSPHRSPNRPARCARQILLNRTRPISFGFLSCEPKSIPRKSVTLLHGGNGRSARTAPSDSRDYSAGLPWPRPDEPDHESHRCRNSRCACSLRTTSKAESRSPTAMPWLTGPVTFAAVIVPVIVPEVVAGQSGCLTTAQEYHHATVDLARSKVQVSHRKQTWSEIQRERDTARLDGHVEVRCCARGINRRV